MNRRLRNNLTVEDLIGLGIIVAITIVGFFIVTCVWTLYHCIQSKKFHQIQRNPRQPNWMLRYPYQILMKKLHKNFNIYTKHYETQMVQDSRTKKWEEKPKRIHRRLRNLFRHHFKIDVDFTVIPDSTCIISIPKRNFICGLIPGTFTNVHDGPPESYYEYQMIGDHRIQVVYFNDSGVRHVVGLCIYIEDPYQLSIKYRDSIILKLLKSPVYWSNYNFQEEKMDIVEKNNELTLFTVNRYGDPKEFRFDGDRRKFDEPVLNRQRNFTAQAQTKHLKVEVCRAWNRLVMIEERGGKRMHAFWDKGSKKIEYFKCRSCEEPEDVEPPSYQSLQFQNLG